MSLDDSEACSTSVSVSLRKYVPRDGLAEVTSADRRQVSASWIIRRFNSLVLVNRLDVTATTLLA